MHSNLKFAFALHFSCSSTLSSAIAFQTLYAQFDTDAMIAMQQARQKLERIWPDLGTPKGIRTLMQAKELQAGICSLRISIVEEKSCGAGKRRESNSNRGKHQHGTLLCDCGETPGGQPCMESEETSRTVCRMWLRTLCTLNEWL